MKINFSIWNHGVVSQINLRDMIDPMGASLLNIGEEKPLLTTNWSETPVFFENFDFKSADYVKRIGRRFGLICTEWFDGKRLNGQADERSFAFMEVAKLASFIWSIVDDPAYRDLGKPYAWIEPGWEPDFQSTHEREPIHDLCVFGTPNYTREMIKEKLDRAGIDYIWLAAGTPLSERNNYIGQCRFVLGLPAWGVVGAPSPTRVSIALHNGRPVLDVDGIPDYFDIRNQWRSIYMDQMREFVQKDHRKTMMKAMRVAREGMGQQKC